MAKRIKKYKKKLRKGMTKVKKGIQYKLNKSSRWERVMVKAAPGAMVVGTGVSAHASGMVVAGALVGVGAGIASAITMAAAGELGSRAGSFGLQGLSNKNLDRVMGVGFRKGMGLISKSIRNYSRLATGGGVLAVAGGLGLAAYGISRYRKRRKMSKLRKRVIRGLR